MEQQPGAASTPPTSRPETPSFRFVSPRPRTPQAGLSTSEPTLRFPRPLGNTDLAHWISTSNPDIIKMQAAAEDAGMAESTFELISATDTESQDGNYTSISDSVGSLDIHRPDDVHSIAETEHTYDDESVIDDGVAQQHMNPLSGDGELDDTLLDGGQRQSEPESDEEARSRSSLEYTYNSLGTPSILTPEASNILEKPDIVKGLRGKMAETFRRCWSRTSRMAAFVIESGSVAISGLAFTILATLLLSVLFSSIYIKDAAVPVPTAAATITATTVPAASSSVKLKPTLRTNTVTVSGAGLIPLYDGSSEEWLFGTKPPAVSFTAHGRDKVLMQVDLAVQRRWLTKGCLKAAATRGEQSIGASISSSPDGILLTFPRNEAHGVIQLSLKSTCRPKIEKVVKVHFNKGIVEGAKDLTRHIAHDLSELVPAAAQEAERRFEGAKRSLGSASVLFGYNVQSTSQQIQKNIYAAISATRRSLNVIQADALGAVHFVQSGVKQAREHFSDMKGNTAELQDVQSRLLLRLLDAQVSAKLWWLKISGQTAAYQDYEEKAKDYVSKKQEAALEAKRARHPNLDQRIVRSWSSMLRPSRYQSQTLGRGKGRA